LFLNPISRTHAEADAFQQALNANAGGESAVLYGDASLCEVCGDSGAVTSMARQLGVKTLRIVTPQGVVTIAL
jgi:deoxycytidylate deaminase